MLFEVVLRLRVVLSLFRDCLKVVLRLFGMLF